MSAWAVFFDQPISFASGVRIQERLLTLRSAERIPDTVLFLEHNPVVTLGARGRNQHLLLSREQLESRGIELAQASRGGDVTYHGPGQLVLYPVMRLGANEADAHGYLHNLEEIAIRTAADFGVPAFRRSGMSGAWTEEGKIAAIGFRLRRWITQHGMSFNVDTDLEGFQTIVPCGLVGQPVTSLRRILHERCPQLCAVRECMKRHFEEVCARPLEAMSWASMRERLHMGDC